MGSSKSARLLVKLTSLAKTGYFYVTEKNPRNTPWKLRLIKYDPIVKRRVLFEVRPATTLLNWRVCWLVDSALQHGNHRRAPSSCLLYALQEQKLKS